MGLFDRLRSKPLTPGPTVAEVEEQARRFAAAKLDEHAGHEIDYRARKRVLDQTYEHIDRLLPETMYTVRQGYHHTSDQHERYWQKQNGRAGEEGRAKLAAFVAANPDLGLITRDELDGHDGAYLISWGAERLGLDVGDHHALQMPEAEREALKEQILQEGLRWEEVAEDERSKGYSLTREYAFRAGGLVSLGAVWTPAYKSQDADVLRTVARTRLWRALEKEIEQRVAEHNQALKARPELDAVSSSPATERGQGLEPNVEL